MSRSSKFTTVFSIAFFLLASAMSVAAQGYKPTSVDDAGVKLAADFATQEQATRAKTAITLNNIVKASDKQPKLGARDFMLCLDTNVANVKTFVQAIVTMDQYSNLRLMGWSKSTCGNNAGDGSAVANTPSLDGFTPNKNYKSVDLNDPGADLAAQNAVRLQSKKTRSTITFNEMLQAEDMERSLGTRDFKLCMSVATNGKQGQALALVSVDQYSNYKLTSWTDGKCAVASADGFTVVSNSDAGMMMALDFAIGKHSDEKGLDHKLGKVLKAESKGMFDMTYRICFTIVEEGETETIEAVVTRDQYSNQKLVSWKHSNCGK